jgi:hypothetical protein
MDGKMTDPGYFWQEGVITSNEQKNKELTKQTEYSKI